MIKKKLEIVRFICVIVERDAISLELFMKAECVRCILFAK